MDSYRTCCRVCAGTFERMVDDYSMAAVNPTELKIKCEQIEIDLFDSFNAFCWTCRRISMSVPAETTSNAQLCYLRGQVIYFDKLAAYGLLSGDPVEYKDGGSVDATTSQIPIANEVLSVSTPIVWGYGC